MSVFDFDNITLLDNTLPRKNPGSPSAPLHLSAGNEYITNFFIVGVIVPAGLTRAVLSIIILARIFCPTRTSTRGVAFVGFKSIGSEAIGLVNQSRLLEPMS